MARNTFNVDEELETGFNRAQMRRLLSYVVPFKWKIARTVLIMLSSSAATLVGPYLIKQAIDNKIPNKDIPGLVLLGAIYVVGLIWTGLSLNMRIKAMTQIGQSVIQRIRSDLFNHLQRLSFDYFDSRPHGKILVRVVNYVNSLSDLLSNGIINIVTDLFSLFVIIGFMFFMNVKLTLITLAGVPVLVTFILVIKNRQRKTYQILSNKLSNLNAYLHESISGIKITQAFTRERMNESIFNDVSEQYRASWMKNVKIQFSLWVAVENISVLTVSAIYLSGVYWFTKDVTAGELVAFIGYIGMFWQPITNIGNFYNAIINAMAYLERIFETMDEQPQIKNAESAKPMPPIEGRVTFEDVTFYYEQDGAAILKNIQFDVHPGETIALVGATGSGKTTIVSLISRFYDPSSGHVRIDGQDIKNIQLETLRAQMGVMLQDPFIFSGTIKDNIRYGRLDATDEEIVEAAKAVQAHDFIMEMEDGYDTEVNERGTRLSVGQRQLISFARALLANPRILILDEATSSIDTETELKLQHGLERLLVGRTSFIIAHRLSTIRDANRIFVIDHGQLIEVGNHVELMAAKGAYYRLYTSQVLFMKELNEDGL